MAHDEPIIVVLGTIGGGTSAVAAYYTTLACSWGRSSARVIANCNKTGRTRISANCAAGPLTRRADSFRWNLMCSRRSSESGLMVIAAPPAPGTAPGRQASPAVRGDRSAR